MQPQSEYSFHRPPAILLSSLPEFTRQFYAGEKARRHSRVRCLVGDEQIIGCPGCAINSFMVWRKDHPPNQITVRRRSVDLNGFGAVDVFWSACSKCELYFWSCPALDTLVYELESEVRRLADKSMRLEDLRENGYLMRHLEMMKESALKMPIQRVSQMSPDQIADIERILKGGDGRVVTVSDVNAVKGMV